MKRVAINDIANWRLEVMGITSQRSERYPKRAGRLLLLIESLFRHNRNFSYMVFMLAGPDRQVLLKPITSEQMYRIEENSHSLLGMRRLLMMENAGHGLADFVAHKFKNIKNRKIVVICGTGNNGGDGFVASRHLAGYGAKITVVFLGIPSELRTEEARLNWSIIEKMDSIEIIFGKELTEEIKNRIANARIILDSIFGTGIKGEIREPYASAIEAINNSQAYVLAVDIPSGFDPNSGQIHERCIRANDTVTFHRLKVGLVKGRKYTGRVHVELIGIPPEAEKGIL